MAAGGDDRLDTAAARGVVLDLRDADDDVRTVPATAIAGVVSGRTVRAPRALILRGAIVAGLLDLERVQLVCPLVLRSCEFAQPVNLSRAHALDIALVECQIPGGVAADGLDAEGDLDLRGSTLSLLTASRARIRGNLALDGARLVGGRWPLTFESEARNSAIRSLGGSGFGAVRAEGLTVDGTVSCRALRVVAGEVRLAGACVGELNLFGAVLENAKGIAFCGDRIVVGGSIMCRSRFSARGADSGGAVTLRDARVGGGVNLTQATVVNTAGPAVFADGLVVDGSMLCGDLVAEGIGNNGALRLSRATVGGELRFDGARMRNGSGPSLVAERIQIRGGLFCEPTPRAGPAPARAFRARGEVRLSGAKVDGAVSFDGAKLPDGASLDDIEVSGRLSLRFAEAPAATVDLRGARLGVLCDDPATWPPRVALRGCTYRDLVREEGEPLERRLAWVGNGALDPTPATHGAGSRSPQPYEQLRSVFRAQGDDVAARAVAIASLNDRRSSLPPLRRTWNEFLRWSVGYGYRTWQGAVWLAGVVLAGWLVFALAWHGHMHALKSSGNTPPFHPWLYSLDVVLPVVDFGEQGSWMPTGLALAWYVFGVLAGWILVTAVLGALTATLVRD